MATYTIKIDERNKAAKAFIEMLKHLPFVKIVESESPRYNEETEQAIREAREGKTTKLNLKEFRKQLYE